MLFINTKYFLFYCGIRAGRYSSTAQTYSILLSRVAARVQSWSLFNAKHILPPSHEFRVCKSLAFLSLEVIFHLPVFSPYTSATLSFRHRSTVTTTAGAALGSTARLSDTRYFCISHSAPRKVEDIIRLLLCSGLQSRALYFISNFLNEISVFLWSLHVHMADLSRHVISCIWSIGSF